MKPEWRADRDDKPIVLSNEDLEIFQHYNQWLYTKAIVSNYRDMPDTVLLAHLYVLGERLLDSAFQDVVID